MVSCMGALILATYYWSMYSTYLERSLYGMNLQYYCVVWNEQCNCSINIIYHIS